MRNPGAQADRFPGSEPRVNALNIEHFEDLLRYLREAGRLAERETPRFRRLPGGVSNRTVLVTRKEGAPFVMKQALDRLRVATEWRSDPRRIEREALGLEWLQRLVPGGAAPALLFLDRRHHVLGMEAVPRPHRNWKMLLLKGRVEAAHIRAFAELLGAIHRHSCGHAAIAEAFADRGFFETLRLEPYYRYTAERVREAGDFLRELIEETLAIRWTLVHGDYSPKNVLVHRGRLVLLDHEVMHYGDPAFDVGFSLTHLLSKAHHLPPHREAFLQASLEFWRVYEQASGEVARRIGFEARALAHTLACLLARVEGRSPLEYLTGKERDRQRSLVLRLIVRCGCAGWKPE